MPTTRRIHIIIVYSPDGIDERYRLHFTSERKARKYTTCLGYIWKDQGMMRHSNPGIDSLAVYTVHPLH